MNDSLNTQKPALAKRVVEQRVKKGLSQEGLSELSGLSLRTIQRIEKGESIPRGTTLKKLASILTMNAEELIDLELEDNPNMLALINLSQLTGLVFPLLGLIVPLAIWIIQKNKTQHINALGIKILNFQILWNVLVFATYGVSLATIVVTNNVSAQLFYFFVTTIGCLYLYNAILAVINTALSHKNQNFWYKPCFQVLR